MSTGIDGTVFSGIPQQWYGQRDANGAATGPGGYAKVGLSNMSALAQAGSDEPVMDELALSNQNISDIYDSMRLATHKPLMEMELQTPDVYYVPPKYTADFFDASADFITKAAQELAKNDSDEMLATPYYSSDKFVRATLDFFSSGNYTQADVDRMKASVEGIIKELAEMLMNGEEPDFSKVNGKVDIMGEQISITQLLEMQEYGKELSNQLVGENKEWLRNGSDRTADFARRGLIKSMGMSYGDQIGSAAGELFKSAWASEVDRHTELIKSMGDNSRTDEASILHGNMRKNGASWVYDVFSKIDTSSKENALKSFNNLSGEIDTAIQKFLDQYIGAPGPEKIRAEVNSYFYELMGFNSVNVTA